MMSAAPLPGQALEQRFDAHGIVGGFQTQALPAINKRDKPWRLAAQRV
jgi:hypothetical protein